MSDLKRIAHISIDTLREEVIEQLTNNYSKDVIDMSTYESRVETAHSASTKTELIAIVEDLPFIDEKSDTSPKRSTVAYNPEPTENLVAIFAGNERKGVWQPALKSNCAAIFGGIELDYRECPIPPEGIELNIFCALGGIEITVPEGVRVTTNCIPILGGVSNKAKGVLDSNAPSIHIKGLITLGGLEVKVKK